MDKLIYIIRHGQTDHNRHRIIQGSGVDSDLNTIGRIQRRQFFDHYQDEVRFDIIIHSALKRTRQTVLPFIESGVPALSDARINEMSWGDYEGKKGTPEMIYLYEEVIKAWSIGDFDARLSNAESARQLHKRLSDFAAELKKRKGKKILVCSHGRALRCLTCIIKGEHLREMETYDLSNTGLYLVEQKNDRFKVLKENDLAHRTELVGNQLIS